MQHDSLEVTRARLIHWGSYMDKTEDKRLGFPTQSTLLNAGTGGGQFYHDDPLAWQIEKIMLMMNERCNDKWYEALVLFYQEDYSKVSVAIQMGIGLTTCKIFINCGEAWVDGQLTLLSEQAA